MSDRSRVEDCVREYEQSYRHPELEPFTINRLYDLPGEWLENTIPDANHQGVYVFYDEDESLLYVGKASWNSTVGARIASNFRRDPETVIKTLPNHNWTQSPRYVQTVRVPISFEAPSLEEYLITELRPVDNTLK